jgi:hypothetical protein
MLDIKLWLRPLAQVIYTVKIDRATLENTQSGAPEMDEVIRQLERQLPKDEEELEPTQETVVDFAAALPRFLREAGITPLVADFKTTEGVHRAYLLIDDKDAALVEAWFRETFGCDE